jgi:hypothetical protein
MEWSRPVTWCGWLRLEPVDADGESKNPTTWKSVAEEQAFEIGRYQGRIEAAEAELVKLRAALRHYGWHDKNCSGSLADGTCGCGYNTIVTKSGL